MKRLSRTGPDRSSGSVLMVFVFQLAALEFPPKKLFGNRDERMVSERRSQLEVRRIGRNRTGTGPLIVFAMDCFEPPAVMQ